jgi:dTDP-4-amino-4,6-dideoxygalactose transaminase
MKKMNIPPAKPFFSEEDISRISGEVQKILRSGMLTLGEYTRRFEIEFAKFCGVQHAVAVSSGTCALEIALRSIGLRDGDEVLVPTNTFSATAAAVIFAGGRPVLTDVDAESLCIDLENVEKNLSAKTMGVIAVHVGGLICPEVRAIREFCEDRGLFLVEDAAHAHGSTIDSQPAGSLGDVGCFSFYPTKVMTTGEGGMITTNNEGIARKAVVLRDQGKENFSSNVIVELGYNWRLNEIGAAIGLVQLERVSDFIGRRSEIARFYDGELSKVGGIKPLVVPSGVRSNYYKYVAFLDSGIDREEFKRELRERGVRCSGEVYWPPLHLQPVYQRLLGVREGAFPVAEEVCRRMVCLPIYSNMTFDEAAYVTEKIREVLSA